MLAGATRYGFGLGRCHSTLRPRRVAAPARTRRRRWLPPAVQSHRHPLRALRSWRLLNITSRSSRRSFGAVGRPILQLWGASRGCWVCCQRRILPCHADVARMRHPQFCCAGQDQFTTCKNVLRWNTTEYNLTEMGTFLEISARDQRSRNFWPKLWATVYKA